MSSPTNDDLRGLGSTSNPFAVVPSDTTPLAQTPKGLYVGTGGHVTLRGRSSSVDVVYKNVPSGGYLAVAAMYVRATGTTAADIVAEV